MLNTKAGTLGSRTLIYYRIERMLQICLQSFQIAQLIYYRIERVFMDINTNIDLWVLLIYYRIESQALISDILVKNQG